MFKLLLVIPVLLIAGCSGQPHRLVESGAGSVVSGEFVHDSFAENRLILQTPEKRYESRSFTVSRNNDLAALRKKYYSANRHHWKRIFAGFDTRHVVYSVDTEVRAEDGSTLSCGLVWTSTTAPSGVCGASDGAALEVQFSSHVGWAG